MKSGVQTIMEFSEMTVGDFKRLFFEVVEETEIAEHQKWVQAVEETWVSIEPMFVGYTFELHWQNVHDLPKAEQGKNYLKTDSSGIIIRQIRRLMAQTPAHDLTFSLRREKVRREPRYLWSFDWMIARGEQPEGGSIFYLKSHKTNLMTTQIIDEWCNGDLAKGLRLLAELVDLMDRVELGEDDNKKLAELVSTSA